MPANRPEGVAQHHPVSAQLAAAVATHLTELIELSLDPSGCAGLPGAADSVRAARLTSIKADIHRNLTDSSLTTAALAARHGITVRYLHKLFEDEAMTVSHYVLEGRLALARQLLSNPRLAERTISSIASDAGFGDLSYFNRTFRRRYSVTPSDVRSGGGLSEGFGFPVLSVLPAGAGSWRVDAESRFGEADRMRRPAGPT